MRSVHRQSFDRRDWGVHCRDLGLASSSSLTADVDGAGAALSDAASELRSLHAENVSQHPEKGHVRWYVNRFGLPIYRDFVGHMIISLSKGIEPGPVREIITKTGLIESFALSARSRGNGAVEGGHFGIWPPENVGRTSQDRDIPDAADF